MVSPVDKEEDVGRRLPDDPALQPSKRRKLGDFQEHPGKTNAIDRPLMDSSSDDDDDDDKPLTQRRAFIKRKTDSTKELLQETRFTSSPPSQAPAADPSAEQISMLTKRKRPEPDLADSLQERGEALTNKLLGFIDAIFDDIENDNQESEYLENDGKGQSYIRVTVMRKLTSMALKVAQWNVKDKMDMEKLGATVKLMERSSTRIMETNLISDYSKKYQGSPEERKNVTKSLEEIIVGLESAVMIFEILCAWKIEKQYVSEELVLTCLQAARFQLENTVYPLIDLSGSDDGSVNLNDDTRRFLVTVETTPPARNLLSSMLPLISQLFRRTILLLLRDELNDHAVIVMSFTAMSVFFHDYTEYNRSCLVRSTADDTSVNYYEQMRFVALDVLRTLFSRYAQHRKWILSEILTSLNSLTMMDHTIKRYRLRNGDKIHVTSALLMHLVQCCSSAGEIEDHRQWTRKWDLRYQKAKKEQEQVQIKDLDKKLAEHASETWKTGMNAANQVIAYFLDYLLTKCKSRRKDSYSVGEYRLILQNLLEDILAVLGDPEWPASEVIINLFSTLMIEALDAKKSDQFIKTFAIEWLGTIACRIRQGYKQAQDGNSILTPEWLKQLEYRLPKELNDTVSAQEVRLLEQCQMKICEHIPRDFSTISLLQFQASVWGYEYSSARENVDQGSCETTGSLSESTQHFWRIWLGVPCTDLEIAENYDFPELTWSDLCLLNKLLAERRALHKSFNMLLVKILDCFHMNVATYRTRAVRAIGHIGAATPGILSEPRIRNPIIQRVYDASPSVRDAAVEVLAIYLSGLSEVPRKIYEILSKRIMDTAVNVRRRMVKLLRDLFYKCDDHEIKVDIVSKLVQRTNDNEVTVCDLALKTCQEVLFQPFHEIDKDGDDYFGYSYGNSSKARKQKISALTKIIMDAVANLDTTVSNQTNALAQLVQKTVDNADHKFRAWFEKISQWIVDCLFDHMLMHDEKGETTKFTACLVTIHAFTKACPDLLRETQISTLQPYLSITNPSDWQTANYVLNIYKEVVPRIKYHDPDFIALLETVLLQLISRSPLQIVDKAVSCLCVIVDGISHRYGLLTRILSTCSNNLKQARSSMESTKSLGRPEPTIAKALLICGSLCQNFDFDSNVEGTGTLDFLEKDTVVKHIFDAVYWFADNSDLDESSIVRLSALQALGHVFARQPTLVTTDASIQLMDTIFEQGSLTIQIKLMKVYQMFLANEEERLEKKEAAAGKSLFNKVIDVETLLGLTEEFAELGVNGALMQRYLKKILQCAVSDSRELCYASFEVISIIIYQGLAHPVLCMPAIFAAETSADPTLRNKGYYLHRYAHDKYGSLLYSLFPACIKTAFTLQKLYYDRPIRGYGRRGGDSKVESLFTLPFSIIKQKKKHKMDFLAALVKPFDFEVTNTDEVDIPFLAFLADNLVTLEFTEQEEALYILGAVERILAMVCPDLLSQIQLEARKSLSSPTTTDTPGAALVSAAKAAMAMYILIRVKSLIMEIYDISESLLEEHILNKKQKQKAISRNLELDELAPEWETELEYLKTQQFTISSVTDAFDKFENLMSETMPIGREADL